MHPALSFVFLSVRKLELPSGCLYGGRWHPEGAVPTHEACLACVCARGALSCRRQTCAQPPAAPACHVRRGECCPELHCPDGVKKLDQGASARLDDLSVPVSTGHACVEGGTVYAAGSAMRSGVACEQCFCLGGARQCVRPRCLPPPDACRSQPAPGACCPQRYYCDRPLLTTPPHVRNPHDCQTEDGQWVSEGERVTPSSATECSECFCLGGSVVCQSLSCAPKLRGCMPLVLPGQCCPNKYVCDDRGNVTTLSNLYSKQDNLLMSVNENRSFHSSKSAKRETNVKSTSAPPSRKPSQKSTKSTPETTQAPPKTTQAPLKAVKVPNTTVKSTTKTDKIYAKTDIYSQSLNNTKEDEKPNITTTTSQILEIEEFRTTKMSLTVTEQSATESSTESVSTEQPESTIKIIVNGTVNCTTELSSSTLVMNTTNVNKSEWTNSEVHPRVPFVNSEEIEAHTLVPNEIITRIYQELDDSDNFTINVTSSLQTNTSSPVTSTTTTSSIRPKTVPPVLVDGSNVSKSNKDELDYDYNEPTLPPSLPNLKIIPFVAADAVVDGDILTKDVPQFTSLEPADKFPVYYPGLDNKEHAYPIRREDDYNPIQYPIYVTRKDENINYPTLTENTPHLDLDNMNTSNILAEGNHKFNDGALIGNKIESHKQEVAISNLFSPPAETEGGFIPKSPGAVDEFYSIYPSTPAGPAIPHLTTSMQLEYKDCISSDGERIANGESLELGCTQCICAWRELHCAPRVCRASPGCRWHPSPGSAAHALDLCCGELKCDFEEVSIECGRGRRCTSTCSSRSGTSRHRPPRCSLTRTAPCAASDRRNDDAGSTKIPIMPTPTDGIKSDPSSQISNQNVEKDIIRNSSTMLNLTGNIQHKEFEKELFASDYSVSGNVTQLSIAEAPPVQPAVTTAKVGIDVLEPVVSNEDTFSKDNHSLEYEEDDEEEFSLGSVLKLLLSENYDTKTAASTSAPTMKTSRTPEQKPNAPKIEASTGLYDIHSKFIPMPPSIIPFKKLPSSNAITRIDHLLLGESNSIRETNPRPLTTPRATLATRRHVTKTQQPYTSKPTIKKEITTDSNAISAGTQPPQPAGLGLGLLKLAGCNIYGQMYRLGRIITELSTPCQECRCTEFGVHCISLGC